MLSTSAALSPPNTPPVPAEASTPSSGTLSVISDGLYSAASSVTSLFSSSSEDSSSNSEAESSSAGGPLDHEGEAGWAGSGVWGLSAVGARQRERDRERDHKVRKGEAVEDDGGRRKRQIEWEGFLRYAEQKERELYEIFLVLDRNADMKLDVGEIRAALDKAGEFALSI